jgi:glutamine amidotransferase-like uncharacterized protein
MLDAVNPTIEDEKHQFELRGPPVDGSLACGAAEHLGCGAMTLETTFKGQALEKRVAQHHLMVRTFLLHLGMVTGNSQTAAPPPSQALTEPETIRVALYDSEGSFGAGVRRVTQQLGKVPYLGLTVFKPEDFRENKLDGFNIVIFTGGSGSRRAAAVGEEGRAKISGFVEHGGGYLGICAGSYLACANYSWGLKIIGAKTASPKWKRGQGDVQMELTEKGRIIFGNRTGTFPVRYSNGPILKPAEADSIPDFEPLAYFRTELAEHDTPKGLMVDSPAIVAGRYGKGRVICISPHPEQTQGLEDFVPSAVKWLAEAKP